MFLTFKDRMQDFVVFTPHDIAKFFPNFDKKNLVNWQHKGYIHRIRNNYYCFSDIEKNEDFLFLVANSIYEPSYISLESALSFYQIIPEGVFTITSVTPLKTNIFNTQFSRFSYRSIKKNLFFGYQLINYKNHRFKIADKEKSILDFLHLNPKVNDIAIFEDLRWNKNILLEINQNLLSSYLKLYDSKALNHRVDLFLTYLYA
jgi:predicted transcriptional regulator of viral defense system